jgi:glycerol kinase
MNTESKVNLTKLNVDGGACQNNFLMQFQADILGTPVDRPKIIDVTGMGAAFLAGLATGFWASPSELAHARICERIFAPQMDKAKSDKLYAGWKKAVAQARLK